MSSSSNTTQYHNNYPPPSSTTLPTTSTYLPILDDLLSPDFRPVTYPPVITPLQTPTANPAAAAVVVASSSGGNHAGGGAPSGSKDSVMNGDGGGGDEEAAMKIQKWWKNSRGGSCDYGGSVEEGVRHSIRHRRADEHIRHLESELSRLKSTLSAERKLRSLQYEAIRSLWSQVQKLSINNNPINAAAAAVSPGIMSQSCPNVLPLTTTQAPPPPVNQPTCTCSSEIRELKVKIEREVGELKGLVGLLLGSREADIAEGKEEDEDAAEGKEAEADLGAVPDNDDGGKIAVEEEASNSMKRPDTLDLNNGNNKHQHQQNATGEELQGYADDMAKYVVERGLSDNNSMGSVEKSGGEKKE